MAKEYKTLTFIDSSSGRQRMAEVINQLAADEWKVHSKETAAQDRSHGSTCCLGCILLPIRSKKKSLITVIMERDVDPNRDDGVEETDFDNQTTSNYSSKPWYKNWWVYVIIIFFVMPVLSGIVGGFSRINNTKIPPTSNPTIEQTKKAEDPDELNVRVSHDSSMITIENNENKNFTGCGFTLNQDYSYGSGDEYLIEANSTVKLSFSDFTKNGGTRFNIYSTKPQYLSFHCNRVGGTSGFADVWWD